MAALRHAGATDIVVVDDASTDRTAAVARDAGATVITLTRHSGPAAARNAGVEKASGEILFFVDVDVLVTADAISRVQLSLDTGSAVDAVFGSYDDAPAAQCAVPHSQPLPDSMLCVFRSHP